MAAHRNNGKQCLLKNIVNCRVLGSSILIQIQEVLGRTFRLIDGVKTGGTDQQTVGQGNLRSKIICFQDFPQQERKNNNLYLCYCNLGCHA